MISNISITDLLRLGNKINIIDIRSIEKYNDNHIPFAHNVPYENLIAEPSKYLNRYQTYYIYCQKGVKSLDAVRYLTRKGYHVVNVIGGYETYILEN
jgi:rhodanese-related sulfurtransferase